MDRERLAGPAGDVANGYPQFPGVVLRLTVNEAYRAMFIFLDQYYERDGCRSDDIAVMLSGMA